jgi:hypothetical protein
MAIRERLETINDAKLWRRLFISMTALALLLALHLGSLSVWLHEKNADVYNDQILIKKLAQKLIEQRCE